MHSVRPPGDIERRNVKPSSGNAPFEIAAPCLKSPPHFILLLPDSKNPLRAKVPDPKRSGESLTFTRRQLIQGKTRTTWGSGGSVIFTFSLFFFSLSSLAPRRELVRLAFPFETEHSCFLRGQFLCGGNSRKRGVVPRDDDEVLPRVPRDPLVGEVLQ